jgi:hypothetical protein
VEQIAATDRFLTSKRKTNNEVKSNMNMFEVVRGRRLSSTVPRLIYLTTIRETKPDSNIEQYYLEAIRDNNP